MKKMLIYLALSVFLVNCGGGTHSDYYEGETHKIQGKVMGALENAKVTLYLDDKSEPIAQADVQSDGSYVLEFTPEVHENIVKNNYALLSADGMQKSFKSIVAFYDSNSSGEYSYKDTTISGYTNAIYKIKNALQFDKNITKALVKKFMPLYNKGKYDATQKDAYAFAYNGVMDELAEHNEYDKNETFTTVEKLATLSKEEVELAKENKATKYAFVVAKRIENSVAVQEVTLDIDKNLPLMDATTTYSLAKTKVGATNYFDGAINYTISADNDSILKTPRITTFDSNATMTKSRKNISLPAFKTGSKTSIIKNLKLDLDNAISSKIDADGLAKMKKRVIEQKSFGDCSADVYVNIDGEWELQGRADHVAFRSALNLRTILPKNDSFWGVRKEAVDAFAKLKSKKYAAELMALAEGQDNRVRRAIWNALKNYKNDESVSIFLQDVISTDDKYYSIADAFKALVVVDTAAAGLRVDALLEVDSHTDIIRKSAITYFGSVVTDKNYDRLKKLVAYGGTTWDARPEAVKQLEKYVKTKPKTVDLFVDMLQDKTRDVRRNSVRALNKHGKRTHIGALDEVLAMDPIISRDVRAAKKNILHPPKKPAKKGPEKELEDANKKLDDIRKLIK